MTTRTPVALAALLLIGLSACDSGRPAPDPEPYNEPVAEEAAPEPAPEPEPAPPVRNDPEPVADPVPPPEPTPPDDQVMEDAEATGMTARVARDEEPAAENATEDVDRN